MATAQFDNMLIYYISQGMTFMIYFSNGSTVQLDALANLVLV